uniref:Transforming growth factor beta regulator 1-like n=1 Tax=Gouania willdenowi TaxID=441366 RepID=A0A8C5EJI3_GOUWI
CRLSSALHSRTPSPVQARIKRGLRKTQNEKYRLKYLRLRKAARAMIFENAALCDEVAHLEEKFLKAKEERRESTVHQDKFLMCIQYITWSIKLILILIYHDVYCIV